MTEQEFEMLEVEAREETAREEEQALQEMYDGSWEIKNVA